MNSTVITETVQRTLNGSLSFPEVVAQLLSAGVEYYHVDYIRMQSSYYSAHSEVVTTAIPMENLPPVSPDFDATALRANILDSQQRNQTYRRFTERAMKAGTMGYFAFLRGRRVTYIGRQGDQHTEWFPGAAPVSPAQVTQ